MNNIKTHTRNQKRMYRIHKQEEKIKDYELLIGKLQQELTDYKERNEKAIEYIYKNSIPVHLLSDPPKPMLDFEGDINEVLKILDKKDKE